MATITNAVMASLVCQANKHIVNNVINEFVCTDQGQWRYGLNGRPVMRQISVATMRNGRDSYQTTLRMIRAYKVGDEIELESKIYVRLRSGWALSSDVIVESYKECKPINITVSKSILDFLDKFSFI
jgi:hypothetical protein